MAKKKKSKNKKNAGNGSDKLLSQAKRDMIAAEVAGIAGQLCEDEGIELVHVELVAEGFLNILRVYIDKPGGVTMSDCSGLNRQLDDIIDASVSVDVEFRLEVSSPGIYRELYRKEDYIKFCGKAIKIHTNIPVDGKMKLKGILKGFSDSGSVMLTVDGDIVELDYEAIKKARLTEDNGDDRC